MNIKSLNNLDKKGDFYDLTETSFKSVSSYIFERYIVPREFEMRMDLICNDIYKTTDHLDFLLYFNRIINPFNITEGTTIYYVDEQIIPDFYRKKENEEEVQEVFLNKSKIKRKDNNRNNYLEDKKVTLPPTLNDVKSSQVSVKGNKVTIGNDIFNI